MLFGVGGLGARYTLVLYMWWHLPLERLGIGGADFVVVLPTHAHKPFALADIQSSCPAPQCDPWSRTMTTPGLNCNCNTFERYFDRVGRDSFVVIVTPCYKRVNGRRQTPKPNLIRINSNTHIHTRSHYNRARDRLSVLVYMCTFVCVERSSGPAAVRLRASSSPTLGETPAGRGHVSAACDSEVDESSRRRPGNGQVHARSHIERATKLCQRAATWISCSNYNKFTVHCAQRYIAVAFISLNCLTE